MRETDYLKAAEGYCALPILGDEDPAVSAFVCTLIDIAQSLRALIVIEAEKEHRARQ